MIDIYHATVGANGLLELDFAVDRTGNVHPAHAARYAELGQWISECYDTPVASTRVQLPGSNGRVELSLAGGGQVVDRVMLREDQSRGQRVRQFVVDGRVAGHGWARLANGTSVGNKRIALFGANVTVTGLRVQVTDTAAAPVFLQEVSAFAPCRGPNKAPLAAKAARLGGGRAASQARPTGGDAARARAGWATPDVSTA